MGLRRRPHHQALSQAQAGLRALACVGLCAGILVASCGEDAAPASDPAGQTGAPCDGSIGCAEGLLCVDGACRPRVWPPGARVNDPGRGLPDLPPLADVVADVPDASDLPDGEADALTDAGDASQDTLDDGVPGDIGPPGDSVDAVDDDAGDVQDDALDAPIDDAEPTGDKIVLLVSEDDAEDAPSDVVIPLESGSAWVTELTMPLPGDILGMQVLLGSPTGGPACGLYRPAVWIPVDDGDLAPQPTWTSPTLQPLEPTPEGSVFLFPGLIPVPEGALRVGLILEEPCDTTSPAAVPLSDALGDASKSWLWDPALDPPWIAAESQGVEGRFALRVLIEVLWI